MGRIYVIAEAGVNHNGSLGTAEALVHAAARAGADAVKFQAFRADAVATKGAAKADYQRRATGDDSQLAMLRTLELDEAAHLRLQSLAREIGIEFLSSAFDDESVEMLARLGTVTWKVPSGEITDLPYLRRVAGHAAGGDGRIVLSTGMADLGEVRAALEAIEGAGVGRERVTVLHCSTEYPAALPDVNLRAMVTMGDEFGVEVGYSDHTEGILVPVAAVALGAKVIEKHLTLDRHMPGPDHAASLEPDEFAMMVDAIRQVTTALGNGVKRPAAAELANRDVVRKSIVAARPIAEYAIIGEADITAKRPGTGLSPMRWDDVVGSRAKRDFGADEMIEL